MNVNSIPFPELHTGRLLLRRLDLDDRYDLLRLRSDDKVNQYLDRKKPTSVAECEDFINKIDGNLHDNKGLYWVISLKDDRKLIGTVCFWNFSVENDSAELGYELSPAYQGKGLMHEALEKVIGYGFEKLELKLIIALTHPGNQRSVHLLKRSNFELDPDYKYINKDEAGNEAVYFLDVEMFSEKDAANN